MKNITGLWIVLALWVVLFGIVECKETVQQPSNIPPVVEAWKDLKQDCKFAAKSVSVWTNHKAGTSKVLTFPATGKLVQESHYSSSDEGAKWPTSISDGIANHLQLSCSLLKTRWGFSLSDGCPEVYRRNLSYEVQWTPSENGKAGQGARGDFTKPTLIQEMWQGNMYYLPKDFPKMGTKYLAYNPATKKAVVVSMGYEIGPSSTEFIGGVTREVHWYLEAGNDTQLVFGELSNQELAYGPINCN